MALRRIERRRRADGPRDAPRMAIPPEYNVPVCGTMTPGVFDTSESHESPVQRNIRVTLDPLQTLAQLVAIPSINPMGCSPEPPLGEARLTDFLESTLSQLGLTTQRQSVAPGRDNLIARLDGERRPEDGGRVILLDAHQDTVPVEGMTIDPFAAELRDGRLYGRGACDVKGGMAAILAATARLAKERPRGMPTLLIACTVNEENGFTGVSALTRLWTRQPPGIIPRRPDLAVVAEPTELDLVVAHKGVVRWRCHTAGRAAHSATPDAGESAIYRMARVVSAVEQYAHEKLAGVPPHPMCGPPTISVGTIQGGSSVNTVPDRCTIEIDRRLPPGESPEEAYRALADYLEGCEHLDFPVEHDRPFMQGPALSGESAQDWVGRLAALVEATRGRCATLGVPYATHAAFYAAAGVPSVVFGPGSIEQAHTQDEWISVDQVRQAAEIYYRLAGNLIY